MQGSRSWTSRLSSAPIPGSGTGRSYLKTQMPFACAQGYVCIECGACATPDGMNEVCESEIMQGRASPCVALRKPSGETLNSMSQRAGSLRAFSLQMLILLRLASGEKSRRRSIQAALQKIRSLSLISDYGVSTSKVASLVRQSVKGRRSLRRPLIA